MSPPNLPAWDHIQVCRWFSEEFKVPAFLENDANACALAEWQFGAGAGTENMIFLTFGTGFGAGLILGGRLYGGSCGLAGEIGHVRAEQAGPVGYGKAGATKLGQCLAMLIDLLNPDAIVIGSIYERNVGLFLPTIEETIAREALPASAGRCSILPSALGDDIGDYAAAAVGYMGLGNVQDLAGSGNHIRN